MTQYLFEFVGTLILVLFGDGVCAACSLNKSKAQGAGWVVIALGWGLAVMMGVLVAGPVSGAHLNPAVTLGLAIAGIFPWFCTMPAIKNLARNFWCEVVATCMLVFIILALGTSGNAFNFAGASASTGALGSWPVTCLIMAIGMSLGGTTGYALNPARDLSPRLAHALLPIEGKGESGWWYSWVPVCGPLVGAACAAGLYVLVF